MIQIDEKIDLDYISTEVMGVSVKEENRFVAVNFFVYFQGKQTKLVYSNWNNSTHQNSVIRIPKDATIAFPEGMLRHISEKSRELGIYCHTAPTDNDLSRQKGQIATYLDAAFCEESKQRLLRMYIGEE